MSNSGRFAFLSFLDLISCAFGAAVLIFVVSSANLAETKSVDSSNLLMIQAVQQNGDDLDIEWEIRAPNSAEPVFSIDGPSSWKSISVGQSGGEMKHVLLIPNPRSGTWIFRAYWAGRRLTKTINLDITAFGELSSNDVSHSIRLTAGDRFSSAIAFEIVCDAPLPDSQ